MVASQNQVGEMASFEVAEPVMSRLEDFFAGPEFTSMLGDFMGENASKIQLVNVEEEQPLQNHDLYCRYTEAVEKQLEAFIEREGLSAEEVFNACRRIKEGGDAAWLSCVDYLLAATEYNRFLQLVADFQSMQQWEPEEGEAVLLEDYCLE
mmetsp:Transcript_37823/g.82271  ORF Transcript_37823/g.82271 Transcript_37823/m.82271 type:complete len:151 (-) Transcript_37823:109-561(-)|eukprot:CAMPEP_0118926912 /NCGR_PEP_ID=MMETSP1169-20130426/4513_1 /TAXON_ID=36882 /ORGANISM="Pyramimonas obovata, Strain CCMP722" /LENGTH=150 /DNA_ID=CAMNT_0006868569 /DNA_START=116 /DNA_END=568 /DNA_ORIENTATION=-